jgi:hypothetical protein
MLTITVAAAGAGLSGAAFAETGGTGGGTSGSGSVLGGNQVSVPVSVPVNVCGNAAAVLGDSAAGCEGTAVVRRGSASAVPLEGMPLEGTLLGEPGGMLPGEPEGMIPGELEGMLPGKTPQGPEGMLPGSPKTVPMRQLSAVQPAADSFIPGLAALPIMSALAGLPSQAAAMGPAWRPSLPGGVHMPWVSRMPRTGRLPLGTWRKVAGWKPGFRGKMTGSRRAGSRGAAASHRAGYAAVAQGAAKQAASRGLAALGALPVVTGMPELTSRAAPAALSTLTTGSTAGNARPVSTLTTGSTAGNARPVSTPTADSAPGMGTASFYSLAIGILMAGGVALKMAGRRIRGLKA